MTRAIGVLGTFRVVPSEDFYPTLHTQPHGVVGMLWAFVICEYFRQAANDESYS